MKIWMIWASDPNGEIHWLETAWDDDATAENHTGWLDAVRKPQETHGADNVRVLSTEVDFDAVVQAFKPVEVTSTPVRAEAVDA